MKFLLLVFLLVNMSKLVYSNDLDKLTSIENTVYHELKSKLLDKSYHIYIKAPKPVVKDKKYITVYVLDGGITFPLLASYSKYLQLAEDVPELIIVGISYGTDDWKKGNSRSHDFTAPAKDREHYGGAEKFQNMLNTELFPYIENNYPSNKNKRILFGQSLGGQFAIFNAMFHPDNFWGIIASNPAIHRNLDFFKRKPIANTALLLYVSRAKNDDERFIRPMDQWLSYWKKNKHPLNMKVEWLKNHNHFSAAPEAFRNGIMWITKH